MTDESPPATVGRVPARADANMALRRIRSCVRVPGVRGR